jgi:hypothetical protein
MTGSPATREFYTELRALLGNAPPLDRQRQVEADQARALKSLSELAKRNEEAERRAKATVHALSAKYLKTLEKNPDVHEGDPLFFFGYGLECMEDILHAGYCQVNASVNLYLEELDARFHTLLVMAEAIDAARLKAEALDDARQRSLEAFETRQAAWLDEARKQAAAQREGWVEARAAADAKAWEAVRASQRPLRRAVGLLAVLTVTLAGLVLFYIIKTHL